MSRGSIEEDKLGTGAFRAEAEDGGADGLRPLHADRGRMLQVLWNLLGNALKFTPTGGVVTVSVEARGDEACLSVTDTEPGISPEDAASPGEVGSAVRRSRRRR